MGRRDRKERNKLRAPEGVGLSRPLIPLEIDVFGSPEFSIRDHDFDDVFRPSLGDVANNWANGRDNLRARTEEEEWDLWFINQDWGEELCG